MSHGTKEEDPDVPGRNGRRIGDVHQVLGDTEEYPAGETGIARESAGSAAAPATDRRRIAARFVDSDPDGRTACICPAFSPDRSRWDRLARAFGDMGVVEKDGFERLSGLQSLAFPRPPGLVDGESWRVAVKVIEPRGNEGLRVLTDGG